jgi:hypothetical protein
MDERTLFDVVRGERNRKFGHLNSFEINDYA